MGVGSWLGSSRESEEQEPDHANNKMNVHTPNTRTTAAATQGIGSQII